jgi:ABC-type lipoprotein export system ATPase subunit
MELLQGLNRTRGITVVIVTHEPDIASYASRVVSFRDGRVVKDERVAKPRDAATERAALPPQED